MKKDIVVGLGEIGMPIYKMLSKSFPVEGIDKNTKLINVKKKNSLLTILKCFWTSGPNWKITTLE